MASSGKGDGRAFAEGVIEGDQFTDENADRPAVGGAVVQGQQQRPGSFFAPQQRGAQPALPRKIEGGERLPVGQPLASPPGSAHCPEVDDRQWERCRLHRRQDALHRHAVLRDQTGAQRFVPAHDLGQSETECGDIEAARQIQDSRHVVGGAGPFELIEEPQPLLSKGKLQRLIARSARNLTHRSIVDECFGLFYLLRIKPVHQPTLFAPRVIYCEATPAGTAL